MEDRDIYELFLSVAEHSGQTDEGTREVFSALVRSTLRYRDHVLESKGITVTVEDGPTGGRGFGRRGGNRFLRFEGDGCLLIQGA